MAIFGFIVLVLITGVIGFYLVGSLLFFHALGTIEKEGKVFYGVCIPVYLYWVYYLCADLSPFTITFT